MLKRVLICAFACAVWTVMPMVAGERSFSWTPAPARGDNIGINLNSYALGKYLNACQINRPEILNETKAKLENGEYYRKRTKDQRGKNATVTIYVDNDYMLHITTWRDEPCPTCNGTGKRAAPFDKVSSQVSVQFRCLECDGEGVLKNHMTEKYFLLSAEDFENPQEGRQVFSNRAYAEAPEGAEMWVERLVSKDPVERLRACEWLDRNYVREGAFFQDIMPMLKKARYYDSNEKKRIMVWQFWAGKDMPNEKNRAYYRIYADTKSGKITKKGFYGGN